MSKKWKVIYWITGKLEKEMKWNGKKRKWSAESYIIVVFLLERNRAWQGWQYSSFFFIVNLFLVHGRFPSNKQLHDFARRGLGISVMYGQFSG